MSIASQITRLRAAKSDIKRAVESKGVGIPPYTFGEFQWLGSDGWYKYCNNRVATGDIIDVKLSDYSTYRVGVHLRSKTNVGGNNGRMWDSGWQTADYSVTVSSAYNQCYLNIIISKRNGSSITKEEAEEALSEFSVKTPTITNYHNYISNIPTVTGEYIEKVVATSWTDVVKFTNENLTAEDYYDYGAGTDTRGFIYVKVLYPYNFYASVSVNSDSILKYEFFDTNDLPESGKAIASYSHASGWKQQSVTGEVTYLSWGGSRCVYLCMHVTYISGGKGIPTLEEVKSNATFELKTIEPVLERQMEPVFSGVTNIPSNAYKNNTNIIEMTLPSSIKLLDAWSFQGAVNLRKINLEDITGGGAVFMQDTWNLRGDIYIKRAGLEGSFVNSGICSFRIDNLTSGYLSFDGCKSLQKVALPSNITSLGNYMFRNCSALTLEGLQRADSGTPFLSTVTSLATGVFQNCSSLTGVINMPALTGFGGLGNFRSTRITGIENMGTVTSMGNQFDYVSTIEYIKFPSTITSMGNMGFSDCKGLKTVYMYPTTPPSYDQTPFRNCTALTTIYVPSESLTAYQTATGWVNHASIMQAM